MSSTTREINKITGAVIRISVKLIVYALLVLLLYEGITRGYAFGHDIFYAASVEKPPGRDKEIVIEEGTSVVQAAKELKKMGLIDNEYSFIIQCRFYDYTVRPGAYTLNTSMTSKEILQKLNEVREEEESDR